MLCVSDMIIDALILYLGANLSLKVDLASAIYSVTQTL